MLGLVQAFTTGTLPSSRISQLVSHGYVPSGFSPEEYKKFKETEAKQKAKKNLGGLGPRGFKSRSFQSFQEALERGETDHLLPVFNAKEKMKKGELKLEDIPVSRKQVVDLFRLLLHRSTRCSDKVLFNNIHCISTCNEEGRGTTPTLRVRRKLVGLNRTRSMPTEATKKSKVSVSLARERVSTGLEHALDHALQRVLQAWLPNSLRITRLLMSKTSRKGHHPQRRKRRNSSVSFKKG